jgi:type I restriction system adenine methylase HsdM
MFVEDRHCWSVTTRAGHKQNHHRADPTALALVSGSPSLVEGGAFLRTMALKKSELYSSLWASCDELRGGMDASQYKDYVLVLLFVKYVSDKFAGKPFAPITIPEGASFKDMVALKGKADIGDQINKKILGPLAQANHLSDMPDFNDPNKLGSGKEMVDRLTNLIAILENPALDFSKNRADGDDLLGDAYEYLMRHFATESGKSKGQFYTPAEVSRVIAQILGIRHADTSNDTTVYDPACGSGSLLLKIGDEARHDKKSIHVTLHGQEKDSSTAGLARMNMILHDYATAEIKQGNTLANPLFLNGDALQTFDYVVANPPFSDKRWSTGLDPEEDRFGRFTGYGVPPAKQGDYAYLLHILRSMRSTGKGACILPHGVLFRGNAEAAIRRNLIQRGVIKGIIGLPANLFYGTGIPACIVVLDKENAAAHKGIFMIDASKGFIKDGNKNRLREQDIHRIVDTFTRQVEIPRYSRLVPVSEIADARNDYNLNLPRYIDSTEPEDLQDISAHLRGGIPERDIAALDRYWQVIPEVRAALFAEVVAMPDISLPDGMHPAYAETHFQQPEPWEDSPAEFAIITAHATTGEQWSDAENAVADETLEAELKKSAPWVRRLTGYSPATGHAEKGWAVALPFDAVCEVGLRFRQDAIYYIRKDCVAVSFCDPKRRAPVEIGSFRARVHIAPGRPVVRAGYAQLRVPVAEVKATIFGHPQFAAFIESVTARFEEWRGATAPRLRAFGKDGHPKSLIEPIAEALLATFENVPLLDAYDIYQHGMDYWAETMQDDCYLIAADGWREAAQPRLIVEDRNRKTKARPDFTLGRKKYQAELLPPALIIARYYAADQAAIEALEAQLAGVTQRLEEIAEEHGGEEGLLVDALNDKGKLTHASAAARLREIKHDPDAAEERQALTDYLALSDQEADTATRLKAAQEALTEKVATRYGQLTEEEIQALVVDDKWLTTLAAAVQGELDHVSQTLTGRIRQLAERYAAPLPQLTEEVETLSAKVAAHLEKMGHALAS